MSSWNSRIATSGVSTPRPAPQPSAPKRPWLRRLTVVADAARRPGMKVAFATEDMSSVDAHFGWASRIAIYEVDADDSRLVEVAQFDGHLAEDGNEDKLVPKLNAIRDCAILYVAAIGGSAAAQVIKLGVHPVKVPGGDPQPIAEILARLREVIRHGTPPPWLRKALLKGTARSFIDDEA